MGNTASSLPLRRSTRVNIGCPVRISGLLGNQMPFAERARIVSLSKFGARVRTQAPLKVGMQLKIELVLGPPFGVFNVVWTGRPGTPNAGEAGVENVSGTTGILGINFPDQKQPFKSTERRQASA